MVCPEIALLVLSRCDILMLEKGLPFLSVRAKEPYQYLFIDYFALFTLKLVAANLNEVVLIILCRQDCQSK